MKLTLLRHNSVSYKVVCVHTSGEVDNFNTHCSALIAAATGQI